MKKFYFFVFYIFIGLYSYSQGISLHGPSSGYYEDILEYTFVCDVQFGDRYEIVFPSNDGYLEVDHVYEDPRFFYVNLSLKIKKNGPRQTNFTVKVYPKGQGMISETKTIDVLWTASGSTINGPSYICPESIATYYVENMPVVNTPIWEVSDKLHILSGQGTNQITVQKKQYSTNGPVTIKLSENSRSKERSATIGHLMDVRYTNQGVSGTKDLIFDTPLANFVKKNTPIQIYMYMPELNSFDWEVQGGDFGFISRSANSLTFRLEGPSTSFILSFNRGCCIERRWVWFFSQEDYSIMQLPGVLTISTDDSTLGHVTALFEIIEVNTGIIKKQNSFNDNYHQVDISDLKDGLYIVKITANDKIENHKIIIKK